MAGHGSRRTLRVAIAVSATAAALAGCGSSGNVIVDRSGLTEPPTTVAPAADSSPRVLPQLDPSQTAGLSVLGWDQPQVTGMTAVVRVSFGGCKGAPAGATVAQTAATVTLLIYDRKAPGPICAAYLATDVPFAVTLPAPLAGRTLTGGTPAP